MFFPLEGEKTLSLLVSIYIEREREKSSLSLSFHFEAEKTLSLSHSLHGEEFFLSSPLRGQRTHSFSFFT